MSGLISAATAGAAGAQTTTPVIPENYSLPPGDQEQAPTPTVPVPPAPTPTPVIPVAPAPAPARTAPGSAPVTSPTLRAPAPRPQPSASPSATPTPAPAASPTSPPPPSAAPPRSRPRPTRIPDTVPVEPQPMGEGAGTAPAPDSTEGLGWWAGALIAALLLAGVGLGAWLLVRRRAPQMGEREGEAEEEAVTAPLEPASTAGARLRIDFRPTRAGINLVTATVMGELTITNGGDAPAERVVADVRLISAHEGQDEEIRAIHGGPLGRPAAPAFSLAAGQERRLSVVAALPNGAIRPIKAGVREMFAPLVVVTAGFEDGGTPRRTGRAFAVGIRREGAAKLAPIWLDGTARMHDQVAARAHGEGFVG